ncbi:unnamed protein product [Rangifer tarandus platyrhynchus]|uniref:Uncharacterized protein n=1 Tax=Rangifer tarandus platyrhynchus TaxID=3082113 RepID=A0AC59YAI6_RANTA
MSICIPTSKREMKNAKKKKETRRGPGRPPGRPLRPPSEGAFILSLAFGSLCVASQRCRADPCPWAGPFTPAQDVGAETSSLLPGNWIRHQHHLQHHPPASPPSPPAPPPRQHLGSGCQPLHCSPHVWPGTSEMGRPRGSTCCDVPRGCSQHIQHQPEMEIAQWYITRHPSEPPHLPRKQREGPDGEEFWSTDLGACLPGSESHLCQAQLCGTGQVPRYSVPQFPHLQNGD